jgi:hypothetical protein
MPIEAELFVEVRAIPQSGVDLDRSLRCMKRKDVRLHRDEKRARELVELHDDRLAPDHDDFVVHDVGSSANDMLYIAWPHDVVASTARRICRRS